MIIPEIQEMEVVLESFLGKSKDGVSSDYEMEFGCPRCCELYGQSEVMKYNLAVNLRKGLFKCWKCESDGDDMHGSVTKLIKSYGNENALKRYRELIESIRTSELYKLHFNEGDFNVDLSIKQKEELEFPKNYVKLVYGRWAPPKVLSYLGGRNINWDIINMYDIGYTRYDKELSRVSNRIIIPSYGADGSLNYWTGRDFTDNKKRQKYYNPKVERKDVIFNEDKVQWDADITLVEGPFDHIVVPNSIPLLGKVLKPEFRLFRMLNMKAKADINIFLDADAYKTAVSVYKVLNHGDLYNRIRFIPVEGDEDPSSIFQKNGPNGIAQHLACSEKIKEVYLF